MTCKNRVSLNRGAVRTSAQKPASPIFNCKNCQRKNEIRNQLLPEQLAHPSRSSHRPGTGQSGHLLWGLTALNKDGSQEVSPQLCRMEGTPASLDRNSRHSLGARSTWRLLGRGAAGVARVLRGAKPLLGVATLLSSPTCVGVLTCRDALLNCAPEAGQPADPFPDQPFCRCQRAVGHRLLKGSFVGPFGKRISSSSFSKRPL